MIRITSKKDGFRRCGVAHPKATTEYPADKFSAKELKILEAEPNLVVEVGEPEVPKELKPEAEVIAEIGKAQTKPDLSRLGKGDTRQPVLDAIVARLKVIESRPVSKEVIKKIKTAKTVAEVNQIVGKDDREGVRKEAAKKRKELTVEV